MDPAALIAANPDSRNFCRVARANDHIVGRKAFASTAAVSAPGTDLGIEVPGWVHLWRIRVSLQESVPPVGAVSPIRFLLEVRHKEEGSRAESLLGTDTFGTDRGFADVSILSHPAVINLGGIKVKDLHIARMITLDENGGFVNFWGSVSVEYSEVEGEYLG